MTLGEKIKLERKRKGLTQGELSDGKMTRNMLSYIENGLANPSIENLKYISERLDLPIGYLLSDTDDPISFKKAQRLAIIKEHYSSRRYDACISEINALGPPDDELALMLADSYTAKGHSLLMNGQLASAEEAFLRALEYCKATIYDTTRQQNKIPMYLAICKNVQAPLLEFDKKAYEDGLNGAEDVEFYKYLTHDYDYEYKNETYALHMKAKRQLKDRNYGAALAILTDIVQSKRYSEYNAYVMFCIYFDMENAYRQLFDFENAYRYASKRMSLIEGFKT